MILPSRRHLVGPPGIAKCPLASVNRCEKSRFNVGSARIKRDNHGYETYKEANLKRDLKDYAICINQRAALRKKQGTAESFSCETEVLGYSWQKSD
jgi:hypothetical protein